MLQRREPSRSTRRHFDRAVYRQARKAKSAPEPQVHCPRQAWKSWPSTTGLQTCTRTARPVKRRVRRPTAKAPAGTVRTVARLLLEAQATPRQPSRTWTSEDEKALEAAFQQAQASELPRNLTFKFHLLQCSGGEDKIRCRRDSSCAVPRHATQAPQEPQAAHKCRLAMRSSRAARHREVAKTRANVGLPTRLPTTPQSDRPASQLPVRGVHPRTCKEGNEDTMGSSNSRK